MSAAAKKLRGIKGLNAATPLRAWKLLSVQVLRWPFAIAAQTHQLEVVTTMSFSNSLRPIVKATGGLLVTLLMGAAQAAPIFQDHFQSGLGQWSPILSGHIVADPFNASNSVLSFRSEGSGGDTFTTQPYLAGGSYFLSFDVLGTCANAGGNCGAFIGIDQFPGGEIWIAGDNTYNPVLYRMVNNGQWQHFEFAFTANAAGTFRLKVEDFVSGVAAGDVFFDNICISSTAGDVACPRSVPEPGSLALVGASLLGLAGLRRKRA